MDVGTKVTINGSPVYVYRYIWVLEYHGTKYSFLVREIQDYMSNSKKPHPYWLLPDYTPIKEGFDYDTLKA